MSSSTTDLLHETLNLPDSLWAATAQPWEHKVELSTDIETDVLIIGSGFTGSSAAIFLAEHGIKSVVLEAAEPGWGASGRNNGQVIAGLKQDPDIIEQAYPNGVGEKMIAFSSQAPSIVFNLIKKYNIDCHAINNGWIQPAFTKKGEKAVLNRAKLWSERGIATQLIEGSELHHLLGTTKYHIGWLDPRGGCVQPLSYARGLAKTALSLGVQLYCRSKVLSLTKTPSHWIATTARGSVKAAKIIIATGAYAEELIPHLKKSFVPVRTAQIASTPLSTKELDIILPQRHVASDTRELLTSFRISPDNRLVMGGSGATAGLHHDGIVPYLKAAGEELFKDSIDLRWAYQWSGYFAVTNNHLPHIHYPAPNMFISVGCNGRGIAISTALGIELAKCVLGEHLHQLPIPVSYIKTIPFYEFRHIGVAIATRYKRLQDYFDF